MFLFKYEFLDRTIFRVPHILVVMLPVSLAHLEVYWIQGSKEEIGWGGHRRPGS